MGIWKVIFNKREVKEEEEEFNFLVRTKLFCNGKLLVSKLIESKIGDTKQQQEKNDYTINNGAITVLFKIMNCVNS